MHRMSDGKGNELAELDAMLGNAEDVDDDAVEQKIRTSKGGQIDLVDVDADDNLLDNTQGMAEEIRRSTVELDNMSQGARSARLADQFLEAQSASSYRRGNGLIDDAPKESIDDMLRAQGLGDMLKSERSYSEKDMTDAYASKEERYLKQVTDLEMALMQQEEKTKDQMKINTELADKIQQLEFDIDMANKENNNLRNRAHDFEGMLASGEMEAQLQFKDQELEEYRSKLDEERKRFEEYTTELKEEIDTLKKQKLKLA